MHAILTECCGNQTLPHTHFSNLINNFLTKHNIPRVHQALYFFNMALFWMFSRLKVPPKETRFESNEHYAKCDRLAKHHSTKSPPGICSTMEGPLRKMWALPKKTLKVLRVSDLKTNNCILADQRSDFF